MKKNIPVVNVILLGCCLIPLIEDFRLFFQIILIIFLTKLSGSLCRRLGQPAVVGEMLAGILLGPVLLGDYSYFLFPKESLPELHLISQAGLILFMFMVGMELDIGRLKKSGYTSIIISHTSIMVPFVCGILISFYLYPRFSPKEVEFWHFALFMGVAMSITAFPVLARIVKEKGLSKTKLGELAISCAAVDDVTAWCMLGALVAWVRSDSLLGVMMIIPACVLLIWILVNWVKPKLADLFYDGVLNGGRSVLLITLVSLSAYMTEYMGIHALFGAFLVGIVIPETIRKTILSKIEDLTVKVLLPLFFATSGLRMDVEFIGLEYIGGFALILAVAVAGKLLGSSLAAKWCGLDRQTSYSIGVLMNTRGLMELVVLNIGLDLGIIHVEIYGMMVFMALLTTIMTTPLLKLKL